MGDEKKTTSADGINNVYIFFNTVVIALGFMQFGCGMNSFSNTQSAWQKQFGWTDVETNKYGNLLQSISIAGAAIGSIACSKLLDMPKIRGLLLLNAILVFGVGITLVGYSMVIICIGRFFWGIAYGAFTVMCAKYVSEICPNELSGPFGALS